MAHESKLVHVGSVEELERLESRVARIEDEELRRALTALGRNVAARRTPAR